MHPACLVPPILPHSPSSTPWKQLIIPASISQEKPRTHIASRIFLSFWGLCIRQNFVSTSTQPKLLWYHLFSNEDTVSWVSEVRQIVSGLTAKAFAKNAQLPPAWVAQAARGSALQHSWGCFPLPACNLPCTLLGGDSSSLNNWGNVWQLKAGQRRLTEGQLRETALSKAIKWALPSALISHQTACPP